MSVRGAEGDQLILFEHTKKLKEKGEIIVTRSESLKEKGDTIVPR